MVETQHAVMDLAVSSAGAEQYSRKRLASTCETAWTLTPLSFIFVWCLKSDSYVVGETELGQMMRVVTVWLVS